MFHSVKLPTQSAPVGHLLLLLSWLTTTDQKLLRADVIDHGDVVKSLSHLFQNNFPLSSRKARSEIKGENEEEG